MDSFNTGFTSSSSIRSSSVINPSFNGGNNENELNPEMASKLKKQLPNKNFMSPTISAAIKAAVPKKKILAERNETLDVDEKTSFASKSVTFPVRDADKDLITKSSSQPYDPIKNYLSPRPKFLRYNPDRRRKVFVVQENEESVKSSSSFDVDNGVPSSGLELGGCFSGSTDSCSQKESVEEPEDIIKEEDEGEEDEEEMVEYGEDRGWNLKGFLKFFLVVIALMLTTQAICSMNSPTPSHPLESLNDWYSNVYGVVGLNSSEVVRDPAMEVDLVVGRLKEGEVFQPHVVDTIDGVYEDEVMSKEEASDLFQELGTPDSEVGNDEADVILDETWSKQEDFDAEIAANEVMELEFDEEGEIAEDLEDQMEKIDDIKTTDFLIRSANFDLTVAGLIGVAIILTSFGVIRHSNRMKPSSPVTKTVSQVTEKEEIKNLEAVQNPPSLVQQIEEPPLMNSASLISREIKDVSKETSSIHAPSVELLGEFVFETEADSNSSSIIQSATSQTKSSHVENSTVKKQRRKNVEMSSMVTPSPVRRSSRLQNRSVMSP